jgi:hypothetical protein
MFCEINPYGGKYASTRHLRQRTPPNGILGHEHESDQRQHAEIGEQRPYSQRREEE